MPEIDLAGILHLLKKVNQSGIKVALENEGLSLKLPKGREIDPVLLNALKENKDHLVKYFKNYNQTIEPVEMERPVVSLEYNGESYFEITPTQLYWVDEHIDEDYKQHDLIHGNICRAWQIDGHFNPDAFRSAVAFLVARHESLRASFHKINGNYFMKVGNENSPIYQPEYIDQQGQYSVNELIVKGVVRYDGHTFDLGKGPLFQVRLIRVENEKYLVSIKMHHVIADTISLFILERDLFVAYKDISEGRKPHLAPLKSQYKEYLFFENCFSRKNSDADRKYWNNLYKDLPGELIIPGTIRTNTEIARKVYRAERSFHFPKDMVDKLNSLAGEFSTSLFIIIQATVKSFFFHQTGQNDILTGTYVFGRQHRGSEDQIGCYAKTALIRTVFDRQDSFYETIRKVKKSNEDMRDHQAFPLKDFLERMLPPEYLAGTAFWNINIQFSETNKKPASSLQDSHDKVSSPRPDYKIDHIHIPGLVNSLIGLDMQFKFLLRDKELSVEVQYDGSLYDPVIIKKFMADYLKYVEGILKDLHFNQF